MKWNCYDAATGLFTGRVKTSSRADWKPDASVGFAWIVGDFDHQSQRVDIETGEVVDYRPPQPSSDHVWSESARRWELRHERAEADRAASVAMAQITDLETASLRALREGLLEILPEGSPARERLLRSNTSIRDAAQRLKR